ncbi:ESX secretion-associated protein EspG [Umezawaea tangerina]|uniref:ESAT-6 protein secretion system EspG family protein n=1 Tax=Umezawaea tangerina TaxID=84725 RepID=A0A2T0SGX5_9PSEU|nr:ESX secretion-associated protein EspG [Umezawaea tangerina]PRY32664.1 ESAT-6 protein secretion system EspG family protein [Umezawaea tangerina]
MSSAAYLAAWEHLDLGAMPIVLHVQHDRLAVAAALSELSDLDLLRGNEIDPWLTAAFTLLANPPRSADLRLGIGRSGVRALAGSAGGGGVLAVLSDHELTVRDLAHEDLAAELVTLVPPFAPATRLRGRFGAAVLDPSGRRRRAADSVDFHDAETGRLLSDGTAADPEVLKERVVTLLRDLDG